MKGFISYIYYSYVFFIWEILVVRRGEALVIVFSLGGLEFVSLVLVGGISWGVFRKRFLESIVFVFFGFVDIYFFRLLFFGCIFWVVFSCIYRSWIVVFKREREEGL